MQDPFESTMDSYLAKQYLARIGYAPDPEHLNSGSDPTPRPQIRPATIEEVQTKVLTRLKEQYPTQQEAPSVTPSRAATQTRMSNEEASSPSIFPNLPSTTSTPGTEASYRPSKPSYEHNSPRPPLPLPPPTKAEILAALHSELQRRQKSCLGIERQIKACQKEIRAYPSQQKNINKEHEKRIAKFANPVHDGKQNSGVHADTLKAAQTAEEARIEEKRSIYRQYDRELIGVPTAEAVDAFFAIIASTEHRVKKAEEANKVAKRREVELEEKLYGARCAMFEMEDEIEEVENGVMEREVRESRVGKSRVEGHKEGKGRGKGKGNGNGRGKGTPRRKKGVQGRQQGNGDGGDERVEGGARSGGTYLAKLGI